MVVGSRQNTYRARRAGQRERNWKWRRDGRGRERGGSNGLWALGAAVRHLIRCRNINHSDHAPSTGLQWHSAGGGGLRGGEERKGQERGYQLSGSPASDDGKVRRTGVGGVNRNLHLGAGRQCHDGNGWLAGAWARGVLGVEGWAFTTLVAMSAMAGHAMPVRRRQ